MVEEGKMEELRAEVLAKVREEVREEMDVRLGMIEKRELVGREERREALEEMAASRGVIEAEVMAVVEEKEKELERRMEGMLEEVRREVREEYASMQSMENMAKSVPETVVSNHFNRLEQFWPDVFSTTITKYTASVAIFSKCYVIARKSLHWL